MGPMRNERSFHPTLTFLAGAIAMLGALLVVARVSGGERSDRPSPAQAAQEREDAYAASSRAYCGSLAMDRARESACVAQQVAAARQVYAITIQMRHDDPRRRIFSTCERAFGADMNVRLACYQERLAALQFDVAWRRPTDER